MRVEELRGEERNGKRDHKHDSKRNRKNRVRDGRHGSAELYAWGSDGKVLSLKDEVSGTPVS